MTPRDMLLGWAKAMVKSLIKRKSNPGVTIHFGEGATINWTNNFINISDNNTFKLPKPPDDPEDTGGPSEGGS